MIKADNALAKAALERAKAKDFNIGEKLSALSVSGIMTGKSKMGMGLKKMRNKEGGALLITPKPKLSKVGKNRKRLTKTSKKCGYGKQRL